MLLCVPCVSGSTKHNASWLFSCMQINIGGGHQLEATPSELDLTTAAAAVVAHHQQEGEAQSASSADKSDPELQTLAQTSLPGNKRRRLSDTQVSHAEARDSENHASPTDQSVHTPHVLQSSPMAKQDQNPDNSDVSSDSDDDDLLVVKRRDVLSDSAAAAADEGGIPLGGVELRGNKKRKKLRIDPGKTSGARTVFDEAGESLQPLALLAREQLDR